MYSTTTMKSNAKQKLLGKWVRYISSVLYSYKEAA
jgi:hypothetical protein